MEDSADLGPNASLDSQGIAAMPGDNESAALGSTVPDVIDPRGYEVNESESQQLFHEALLLKQSERGAVFDSNSRLTLSVATLF